MLYIFAMKNCMFPGEALNVVEPCLIVVAHVLPPVFHHRSAPFPFPFMTTDPKLLTISIPAVAHEHYEGCTFAVALLLP
jgi:hypothetical protein